ncbi:MAG: nucleotidyltransferase domain-containing protein [Bacteroidia bacterium]|nr:nucleotidyltransferase domain-containing protein [Bacteroidia bacterium]MCF8426454.1 nucleotidyltransferase domain-containing protein [Bacteroidia bacterium]MCF8447624.1 nucleotidyltransferase domain-containing protein [Bacteroidia bacterium]
MTLLSTYIDQIKDACAANKVKSLFAFGSVTNDKFRADSDIDLIVDLAESDPLEYTNNYFDLKEQLEKILNRHIDLLEQKAIRNPFLKKEIDQTKVLIYEA